MTEEEQHNLENKILKMIISGDAEMINLAASLYNGLEYHRQDLFRIRMINSELITPTMFGRFIRAII